VGETLNRCVEVVRWKRTYSRVKQTKLLRNSKPSNSVLKLWKVLLAS
jgi:hypothetical protein